MAEAQAKITLKKILFATDFEALANQAMPFAVVLANRYHAKFYAVHVIPRAAYAYGHPELMERTLKEAHDYAGYELSQIVASLKHRGCPCEPLLADGDPGEVITALAQTHEADLIVVGTTSRGSLGKALLGSVAEQVIREAPCPVLTIGPQIATDGSVSIQTILFAIDFSPESLRAVHFAFSFAQEYGALVALLHVMREDPGHPANAARWQIQEQLCDLIPSDGDPPLKRRLMVMNGRPSERILGVARDLSADIIAMGVRGAGAFANTALWLHRTQSIVRCTVPCADGWP
jgi:nucleotide-binding universal stress UspA family protein